MLGLFVVCFFRIRLIPLRVHEQLARAGVDSLSRSVLLARVPDLVGGPAGGVRG